MFCGVCIGAGFLLITTELLDITPRLYIYLLGVGSAIYGILSLCFCGTIAAQVCDSLISGSNKFQVFNYEFFQTYER